MKRFWGASTLILAAFAMSGAASAADLPVKAQKPTYREAGPAPVCGPYWAAFGGWNHVSSMSDTLPDPPTDGWREIEFKDGYVVGGAIGRCIPGWNWLRIEGEVSYRKNNVKNVTVAGEGTASRSGHVSALAAMANAWADFQVAPNVTVHGGGGIGFAHVKLGISSISVDFTRPVSDSDTVFAFQLGAGAAWRFMPNVAITLDYRYFQAVNPEFKVPWSGNTFAFKDDYQSHSVMVGLRGNLFPGP
jgi:opacity protein-like surface antigen